MLEFGLPVPHALRQGEGPHLLADDFRVEERFGFERHLPGDRVCGRREKTKRIEHQTSNIEQPASKDGDRFTAAKPQDSDLDKLA